MGTVFRKVPIDDRHVNTIRLCYNGFGHESYGRVTRNRKGFYCKDEEYHKKHDSFLIVTHTIEEIHLPSEDNINYEPEENRPVKYTPMWWHSEGWKQGAIFILELIHNKK